MKQSTVLFEMEPKQVMRLFKGLQKQIADLNTKLEEKKPIEWVPRAKVAKMFEISLVTVHRWSVEGKIKPYAIGGKIYYKRHELDEALIAMTAENIA